MQCYMLRVVSRSLIFVEESLQFTCNRNKQMPSAGSRIDKHNVVNRVCSISPPGPKPTPVSPPEPVVPVSIKRPSSLVSASESVLQEVQKDILQPLSVVCKTIKKIQSVLSSVSSIDMAQFVSEPVIIEHKQLHSILPMAGSSQPNICTVTAYYFHRIYGDAALGELEVGGDL